MVCPVAVSTIQNSAYRRKGHNDRHQQTVQSARRCYVPARHRSARVENRLRIKRRRHSLGARAHSARTAVAQRSVEVSGSLTVHLNDLVMYQSLHLSHCSHNILSMPANRTRCNGDHLLCSFVERNIACDGPRAVEVITELIFDAQADVFFGSPCSTSERDCFTAILSFSCHSLHSLGNTLASLFKAFLYFAHASSANRS